MQKFPYLLKYWTIFLNLLSLKIPDSSFHMPVPLSLPSPAQVGLPVPKAASLETLTMLNLELFS